MARRKIGTAVVLIFIACVALFYGLLGENSYIAVQDNLDLFVAQFAMLKNEGIFFSHGVSAPFLNGVSRDVLPSELSLYTILYMFLPPFYAYVVGYILKVLIAVISCKLLFMDFLYTKEVRYKNVFSDGPSRPFDELIAKDRNVHLDNFSTLVGLLYGVLNLFPAFGIPFAAIPLIIFYLRRLYKVAGPGASLSEIFSKGWIWLLLIFCYPFLSYFSYLGFFILGYLFVGIIWLWIKDRKLSLSLVFALILLGIGNVVFEYRLFYMMLFSDTVTIRETMVQAYFPFSELWKESADVFLNGMMHVDDVHKYFVMPLCAIYFLYLNISYVVKKNIKGIFTDYFNLCVLILLFNCIVFGLYYSEAVEHLIETLIPPLTGFQYNRTIFFNPFLWCAILFIMLYRICSWADGELSNSRKKARTARLQLVIAGTYTAVFVAILIVLVSPTKYNDLYHSVLLTAREKVFGHENDDLNYREFYSEKLFDEIKNDIGYQKGEYCVAYGMHPAILEYNGIYTLDGYLGFYSQSYKEQFREVIAPALERMEPSRLYFDEWGARCYLYSGSDLSIVMATKSMTGVTDTDIYIDSKALKNLGCKYIFSRIDITNAEDAGLTLLNSYQNASSPYIIYVYTLSEEQV